MYLFAQPLARPSRRGIDICDAPWKTASGQPRAERLVAIRVPQMEPIFYRQLSNEPWP